MAGDTQRRERKVVTVVFCDLVGFTSQAETMDPEDVEAVLRPYHERVRSELERHGGTVEKFIGDAVMALFGAPTAHEDDPERAVRAALAIREFALEEGLELRVGITTGEALVSLDARPDAGEGMASGDVVNTAARLQAGAPVNGILVDDTTYRATRHVVELDEPQAIEAKGKSAPIVVRRVLQARARFGVDVAHEARSELVGRERELGVVRDAFERARHERTPQLLTLVGVPGIGKSRLVYELRRIVEADSELITWRQGRCLAKGDGITLWALGEIVKAQAGVLEQDSTADIVERVRQSVEDVLAGSGDEGRVESHLLALLGLGEEAQLGGSRRNEAFAAWRRFLEGLAEQRPLVVVVEDIHWADESLLDFLDELIDWVTDVPLLVVATARPELLERRPGWGGGKLNATTLALAPLSDEQTALLLAELLGRPLLEAETKHALLERAGGNPLYAEQFVELYVEQGSSDELGLPETLQGIIAARLDGLSEAEKGLLQDASVVGKVFWASAIGRDADVAGGELHSLERKGFVRRQRRSSLEGESEFAFAHALVRDVSYGQIPRADRAQRHRAVAEWLDSLGRPEDHAEMLAYHWSSALELVRASGGEDDEIVERTRRALRAAGDRAVALNSFAVAAAQYEDALELWPTDRERPDLLFRRARALYHAYDEERREAALEEARDALLDAGDADHAAEAESFLALVWWYRGAHETTHAHLDRAEALSEGSTSASAARVLAVSARIRFIEEERDAARTLAESALAIAEDLGLDELRAHALTTIGMAKNQVGDTSGVEDMERALSIALEIDSPIAGTIMNNLAVEAFTVGDLRRGKALYGDAVMLAERLGDSESARFTRTNLVYCDYFFGDWDAAARALDEFIASCEAGAPHANEADMRTLRGAIRRARGDAAGATADHLRAVELARVQQIPAHFAPALVGCAAMHAERGEEVEARALLTEALEAIRKSAYSGPLLQIVSFAESLGLRDAMLEVLSTSLPERTIMWREAAVCALEKGLVAGADFVAPTGILALESNLRFRGGQSLVALGRHAEAKIELERALSFYRGVNASAYVAEIEAALAEAQRESA